ncbi:MAG: hypothetical protein WCQ20_02200 [Synechococcaceae cyanobacterium ELA739]
MNTEVLQRLREQAIIQLETLEGAKRPAFRVRPANQQTGGLDLLHRRQGLGVKEHLFFEIGHVPHQAHPSSAEGHEADPLPTLSSLKNDCPPSTRSLQPNCAAAMNSAAFG